MTPQVAIIVIAFNEERRIELCLHALLVQAVPVSYEVIVVDDGSSDSTARVVERLQTDHPNLRLVRHDVNSGRGAARLSGQNASDTRWIGFVDADIVVPPHWLQRCLEELSSADGVSGIAQPDGDCAVIWRICQPTLRDRPGSAEITGNNVLFSREALTRVPFSPNAKLGEDFRLATLMTHDGLRLRTIRDLKVAHGESKTYWQALSWMWQSGVDATSLLFEFRRIRVPDLAWLTWLAGLVAVVACACAGALGIWIAISVVVALTLVVDGAFILSRFAPLPHPIRFLDALAISPPLMLAYLAGRSAGLIRVKHLSRRATWSSAT